MKEQQQPTAEEERVSTNNEQHQSFKEIGAHWHWVMSSAQESVIVRMKSKCYQTTPHRSHTFLICATLSSEIIYIFHIIVTTQMQIKYPLIFESSKTLHCFWFVPLLSNSHCTLYCCIKKQSLAENERGRDRQTDRHTER